jgi:hypothetical protein
LKLVCALVLLVAGCSSSSSSVDGGFGGGGGFGGEIDMAVAQIFDFANSGPGGECSASTVQVSCGSGCVACLTLAQSGVCVIPCKTAAPDCPTGLSCSLIDIPDGGSSSSLVYGGACGGFDGICQ